MSDLVDRLLDVEIEKQDISAPKTPKSSNVVDSLLEGDFSFVTAREPEPVDPLMQEFTKTGDVITPGRKPKISEEGATLGAQFKQGLVDDPKTKIKIYAESRGLDPKRYGIDKRTREGEIYYIGPDGYYHYETPDTFAAKTKRVIAEMTADPGLPLGVALSTLGPLFAGLGAAGGEGWRRTIGALFFDDPQTTTENLSKMALSGVAGVTGEKLGAKAIGVFDRTVGKKGALLLKEAGRGRERIVSKEISDMEALGKKWGIDLLPPQTTRSPELISSFNILSDLPETANKIAGVKRAQYEQVQTSVAKFLKSISKKELTKEEAGEVAVKATQKLLSKGEKIRSESAQPFYKEAFKVKNVDIEPVVGFIDGQLKTAKGKVRNHLLRAKKTLMEPDLPKKEDAGLIVDVSGKPLTPKTETFDTTLKGLHDAKTAIDDEIGAAKKARAGNVAFNYRRIKSLLLNQMDSASPDYEKARKIYSSTSQTLEELAGKKRMIGKLSRLEGDEVEKATSMIFSSSPEVISRAKKTISAYAGDDAWNAISRKHIQNIFEGLKDVQSGQVTNVGGKLRQKIYGDVATRKKMESALSKEQFKNLKDFASVLDRTGLILSKESTTASRQIQFARMKERSRIPFVSEGLRTAAQPMRTPWRGVIERMDEALFTKRNIQLADAMLDPNASKQLQRMLTLKPGSQKLIKALSTFLTLSGVGEKRKKTRREKAEEIIPNI